MLNPLLRLNPRNHIFKTAGALIGLTTMGLFGLFFGLIGGALIDQLTAQLRRKNRLKAFLLSPESSAPGSPAGKEAFIEAAAVSTAFYLCFDDPAKTEVLNSVSRGCFPEAPATTTECLQDLTRPDFRGLAEFFGSNATAKQKENLNRLINTIELNPSILRTLVEEPGGEEAEIIAAADFLTRGSRTSADYEILGLGPEATKEEIKHVYYNLASHFHPDSGSELTPEQRKITEDAFKIIKDAYDRIK